MRHIQNESGARAHLRGKGSGHVEIGQKVEQMHILLQADRQAELDYARKLAEDLLATVGREVEASRMIPVGMTNQGMYYPYGSMNNIPGQMSGYQQQMPLQHQHQQQMPLPLQHQQQMPLQYQSPPGQFYPGYNTQQQPIHPGYDTQQQPLQAAMPMYSPTDQQQPDYTNVPPPQGLHK